MLETVKKLVQSTTPIKLGNHKVVTLFGTIRNFYYYDTTICVVNDKESIFSVHYGSFSTKSTSIAINDYRKHFTSLGYTEV